MENNSKLNEMNLETPLTLGILFEFTDEVLLPRLGDVIDNSINEKLKPELAKLEHNLKSYIDDKLAFLNGFAI